MGKSVDDIDNPSESRIGVLALKFGEQAELTRHLALNALFEAARAGEPGRRPGESMTELCKLLESGGTAAAKLTKLLPAKTAAEDEPQGQAELNSAVANMRDLGHRIAAVSNHPAE